MRTYNTVKRYDDQWHCMRCFVVFEKAPAESSVECPHSSVRSGHHADQPSVCNDCEEEL
jgi:hypothetical protein